MLPLLLKFRYRMPAKKIIINLSPAGIASGTTYDLPIALAILGSLGVIPQKNYNRFLPSGELSFRREPASGEGDSLVDTYGKKKQGFSKCIIPAQNVREACLAKTLLGRRA